MAREAAQTKTLYLSGGGKVTVEVLSDVLPEDLVILMAKHHVATVIGDSPVPGPVVNRKMYAILAHGR